MLYSLVIPVLNEEESIPELFQRVTAEMDKLAKGDYEIIFVNDGSTDGSTKKINELVKEHSFVHHIVFRKNLGKAAALSVGFRHAKGTYIITMDADLQDEPTEIPKLVSKMQEGYDMVSGWKEDRQDPVSKTLPSKVFNGVVSRASGLHFHDFNCGFKIYRKEVVSEIQIYGQLYRFIPFLVFERGFKVAEIKVKHNKRKYGKSKYSWKRMFPGLMDFMTIMFLVRYNKRPLHLFGFIGGILFIIGTVCLIYLAGLHYLAHQSIGERPLLIFSAVFFIAGLQSIFTGLIAEMLTSFHHSDKDYPIASIA